MRFEVFVPTKHASPCRKSGSKRQCGSISSWLVLCNDSWVRTYRYGGFLLIDGPHNYLRLTFDYARNIFFEVNVGGIRPNPTNVLPPRFLYVAGMHKTTDHGTPTRNHAPMREREVRHPLWSSQSSSSHRVARTVDLWHPRNRFWLFGSASSRNGTYQCTPNGWSGVPVWGKGPN